MPRIISQAAPTLHASVRLFSAPFREGLCPDIFLLIVQHNRDSFPPTEVCNSRYINAQKDKITTIPYNISMHLHTAALERNPRAEWSYWIKSMD